MSTKATISSGYRWRLGIIGLVALGFGVYCLYDGFIAYPKKQARQERFAEIREQHPDDWRDFWLAEAEKNGWATETPGEPMSNMSIYTQFIMAAIVLPVGLLFTGSFLRSSGRWVSTDDDGLTTNSGQRAEWSQIKSVDTTRWKKKGIAVVHYDRNGQDDRIILDDWKFDRAATTAIFNDVRAHTSGMIEEAPQPAAPPASENADAAEAGEGEPSDSI